jgi:hypothetical protein
LTLATGFLPSKDDLLKRPATKQRSTHRHVWCDFARASLSQIVGCQRRERRSATEFIDQRRNAPWFQDHIVVEKHQPRPSAAQFAFVSCSRNRIPAVQVVRSRCANHAMYDELNRALIT